MSFAWLLSKPAVTVPIVGTTKASHLDAALNAIDLELSDEEVARLEAPYIPHSIVGHS